MPNSITEISRKDGRNYITPEDVTQALEEKSDDNAVRLDVLEVLGRQTDFGAEDGGLCAFIAWRGKVSI
jgi:hypothetical protein